MIDDRVRISVVADFRNPDAEKVECWLATFDKDYSPYLDAEGDTPELALAGLATKLASAILDMEDGQA